MSLNSKLGIPEQVEAEMNLYPEMNGKICGLLRLSGQPHQAYAAQRIEELESLNAELLEAVELVVSLVEDGTIRVRPTERDKLLDALNMWNDVLHRADIAKAEEK